MYAVLSVSKVRRTPASDLPLSRLYEWSVVPFGYSGPLVAEQKRMTRQRGVSGRPESSSVGGAASPSAGSVQASECR